MTTIRKREGFEHERLFVLPEYLQAELEEATLTRPLYVSDIGYFPRARYHYRERPDGCDACIVFLCAEGEGWIERTDDRTKTRLTERQLYILPAGTPHRYGASEHDPWSIYWLHLHGEHAAELIALYRMGGIPLSLPSGMYTRFIEAFHESYDLITSKMYAPGIHAHIAQTVRHLLSSIGIRAGQSEQDRKRESYLELAVRYMTEHLAGNVKLSDVARHTGVSKQHLIHLFKRETSLPPIEYYLRMKMQHAAQLLDLTDLSVKEIGHAVGMTDPYYFSRLFKQMMGHSPSKYREIPKG